AIGILVKFDYFTDGWYVFALFKWIRDGFGGCSRGDCGWKLCSELGSFGSTLQAQFAGHSFRSVHPGDLSGDAQARLATLPGFYLNTRAE
ncbi:MAG: hypothetical protein U9Q37_06690, partial [Euryarchaeota archaeon]|nr:hypothetical protein [Euryarchaeota archaeon]